MDQYTIIDNTAKHVQSMFSGEGSGHDWWHIYRVWQLAKTIGQKEKANMLVVELAALLHDIADHKFHGGDSTIGSKVAGEWLESIHVDPEIIKHIQLVISQVSFKQGHHTKPDTIEGQIVQDADRLDAIGAIGIARAFAYGGYKQSEIYNPTIKPFKSPSDEKNHTINHFYEKLLKLKDLMNTKTAQKLAQSRHQFMQTYLDQFFAEWKENK